MKELFFVNSWPKLETAWSGTPMSLYVALSKRLKLHQLDVCQSTGKLGAMLNILSMGLLTHSAIERDINNADIAKDVPLFVFGEYINRHLEKTYCYQDLSIDYLLRLRQQNHPCANTAIKKVIPTAIIKYKAKKAERFYHKCAGIFTMSEWLYKDLIENAGIPAHKVHHVGGGSNIDITKIDNSKKTGNRFLFVGKAWDRKNGELVTAAFKKLCQANPQVKPELYIAGPSEKPDSVKDCENIIYLGCLTPAELIEYYNLCDYYVMPSKFEAYGLVFTEALCFGLPCIGKNAFAMPEFIQHGRNGMLIEEEDVDELAAAMEKLLLNGREMVAYVQKNRDHYIKQYSWDSVADRICQVIENDGN